MISSERTPQSGSTKATGDQSESATNNSAVAPPTLSLPKGGGAIRGMGEKFAANPVTGTGSMTAPIATSPGRSGFGPQLALSYDSGAGNGPFGLGWNLSLPAITRKTDKGLPQYYDADESDIFILSGAEDLVPVLGPDGKRFEDKDTFPGFLIHRYRPRIEGLFARIERWTHIETGEIHWRSISKDNITTLYGKTNNERIFDPTDPNLDPHDPQKPPTRIFSWLICESYDDKGNVIVYEYVQENEDNVNLAQANERNRMRTANRYLKRIKYGNRVSRLVQPDLATAEWMFEVVFDYDEAHIEEVAPDPERPEVDQHRLVRASATAGQLWFPRPDPFSSYRAGFEVRTYRLCQRVLMFHHFPGEDGVGADCLVRSTDFTYGYEVDKEAATNPIYSKLLAVTQTGYKRNNGSYIAKALPPLEFTYSEAQLQREVRTVDPASLENLPMGLDGAAYQWTDLHGEGIPGILTEQAGAWFYKRNLSPINIQDPDDAPHLEAKFAPVELVALKPNLALGNGAQLMDLAGDGHPDLVVLDGPMPGFYEHDLAEGWNAFRPFTARLNGDTRDPNLKFVDLDGDGHADVLITEDQAFVWHPSLGEAGFGPAQRIQQVLDEEKGPRLLFADGTQSIYLADLSGDGLTDLVRIRSGEVCYWPNLGYGRFGAKVSMDNAPCFDAPDQFNQQRIRLADIDGSGTTDILYLHGKGVRIYFNQSGNSWSAAQTIPFPAVDNLTSVQVLDLLGDGTACLVWSSPLPGATRQPMHYLKLMGEEKPHLLIKSVNNLGAETVVHYAPSTYFYLKDKRDGKPWITRLPFPVHVVERVESYDRVDGNRFVSRYAYHHGYFDGEEREFRGFGMVEQWDTEEIGTVPPDQQSSIITNLDAASYVPPILTRTWFHTGIYLDREHISRQFADNYYREPAWRDNDEEAEKYLLADTVLPGNLSLAEEREACRALKGMMLRQEVYALDGVGKTEKYPFGQPYTVAEQNFAIRRLQPQGENPHAVFFTYPNEVLTYHYERNNTDPRIQHVLTLEVDDYGNVLKSLAIGYGRRPGISPLQDGDKAKQEQTLITYSETDYTEHDKTDAEAWRDTHRTPLPCEARTYEITGFTLPGDAVRFAFEEFAKDDDFSALTALASVNYETPAASTVKGKRLIECIRTRYRRDDLTALLPVGTLQPQALPGENYKLAFTPTLMRNLFTRQPDEALLPNPALVLEGTRSGQGGYVAMEGNWWIPSGQIFYSPDQNDDATGERDFARRHFYLPHRFRDPFGQPTYLFYDSNDAQPEKDHNLLVVTTEDALGNQVMAANDYRVLQPWQITDPNGNRSQVRFDTLGMVVGTAVRGKADEPDEGDSFDHFVVDLTAQQIQEYFDTSEPRPLAVDHLGTATTRILYDLDRVPACAATIVRELHLHDLNGQATPVQLSFSYSDGFGRGIQKKIQAEKGKAPLRNPDGSIRLGADNQPVMSAEDVELRWVGSGWTVFNNKGKPVRQFEPFFSDTHKLDHDVRIGVSPWLFYDPVGRVVATLHPNHTWEKVVFDPWQQTTYDVNDTVTTIPSADKDVQGFFLKPDKTLRLPEAAYRPTWHELRTDPVYAAQFAERYPEADDRTHETVAATKAAEHANTPTIAHFDALGRPFLTIADNGTAEKVETRVELDIEGNQRAVIDARGLTVMAYAYDMLGNRVYQQSMDAGERWMLNDATGKAMMGWNSRNFRTRVEYDALHRPTALIVTDEAGNTFAAERTVYGETAFGAVKSDPAARERAQTTNQLGQPYQIYDGAGVITNMRYDFKGNLLESQRTLLRGYKTPVHWPALASPPQPLPHLLEDERFVSRSRYDALNRPQQIIAPHSSSANPLRISVTQPSYNAAGLLERVDLWLNRTAEPDDLLATGTADQPMVQNIDYNAKGQRVLIAYGNGATTTYDYDDETFRLTKLKTTRPNRAAGVLSALFAEATVVQDLSYTYDPVGNITRIADASHKSFQQGGQEVAAAGDYSYDALYRLTAASGREHSGQMGFDFTPPDGNYRDQPFTGHRSHANDLQGLASYVERYRYDAVGNILEMAHHDGKTIDQPGEVRWRRHYQYALDSNQLLATSAPDEPYNPIVYVAESSYSQRYSYDRHGNMTQMPHLSLMAWDFKDQLHAASQQVRADGGTPEITYYLYDAGGQRVRKVTERQAAPDQPPRRKTERIYLGGFEIYREYNGDGTTVTLERETLHIMDDQQRIALVETQTAPTVGQPLIRYQLGNHLGSASVELDQNGGLISYEEYHPYGTTSFQAGRSAAEVSLKCYRYTGKERDEETGFSYHGARYDAPWLGRWISCDPIGISGGLNFYQYAGGCPTCFVDPSGLDPQYPEDTDIHQLWHEGAPAQNTGTEKQATMSGPPPSGGPSSSQPEDNEGPDAHDADPTPRGEPRRRDDKQLTGIQERQQKRRQQKNLTPPEDLAGAHDPEEWGDKRKPKERGIESTDKSAQDAKKNRQPGAIRRKEALPQPDVRTAPHNQPKPVPPQRPTPLEPPKQDVPKPDPAPLPQSTPPHPTPVPQPPTLPHPAEPRTPSGLTPDQLRRLQEADKPLEQGALDWAAMLTLGFVVSRALVPSLGLGVAGRTGAATGIKTLIPALLLP